MFTEKKIVIAGGTGFMGQAMAKCWGKNNEVIILSRQKNNSVNNTYGEKSLCLNVQTVKWDAVHIGDWVRQLEDCDILINLVGRSVNCRYNEQNKKEIISSRVDATNVLGQAISMLENPPKLWINAASATIYRHAEDRPQDEYTGEIENDFSVQVCKIWEQTFYKQPTPVTRKIAIRTAITLGEGGVMIPYFNLVKFGLGGRQGSGRQKYSWIHIMDVCCAIEWMYDHQEMEGTYNLSAPGPVNNAVFMQTVRKVCGHLFGLPAYEWMLKAGAALIGTETELILKSRWVLPTRLLESGFIFRYPELEPALKSIVRKIPRRKYHLF